MVIRNLGRYEQVWMSASGVRKVKNPGVTKADACRDRLKLSCLLSDVHITTPPIGYSIRPFLGDEFPSVVIDKLS